MQVQLDPLGYVLDVKGKAFEITGRTPSEMTGQRLTDFLHPDALAASVTMWFSLLSDGPGATRSSRRCYIHPDGSELWVEAAYLNRLDEDGGGFISMFAYDITERRIQEETLRQRTHEVARLAEESRRLAEESRLLAEDFRLLADEVPAAVFRCDDEGRVTFSNTRWAELLGAGVEVTSLHETVHPDEAAKLTAELASVVADGSSAPRSFELLAFDHVRIFAFRCRSISDDDPSRRRIVGSIEDVTATVRLRNEARHDALTGALNRTVIERAVSAALLGDAGRMLVVFLDLDGFKEVNDLHGHHAGDVVLKAVAARLASAVRPGDLVGRYGGDEFVVVCQSVGTDDALLLVERLEEALGGPVCFPGGHWQAAASIGTARPQPGDDLGSVLRRADQAMFDQKRHRRRTTAS
jgi:diguanylate cyclase (GGDEF)-like protein/PAS domain S-box-containing protein